MNSMIELQPAIKSLWFSMIQQITSRERTSTRSSSEVAIKAEVVEG